MAGRLISDAGVHQPPGEVVGWCDDLIGQSAFTPLPSRRPGRLFSVDGRSFSGVLKLSRDASAYSAEVHAYEWWTARLSGEAARLMASSASLGALLVSRLDGQPCTHPTPEVCWHAGRALARLQAAVIPRAFGSDSFATVVTADVLYWLALGADVLTSAETAVASEAVSDLDGCEPVSRVPCHGDFVPGNWLVADDGRWVGVVDFEHSRYDAPEADLAFLWDGAIANLPQHQAQLLRGYGGLDEPGRRRLSALRVVAAVARVVGGSHAGNTRVEASGRRALRRRIATT
jgi:Ser/Thr protein kinase RdoA (MazF antagonist)